MHNPVKPAPRKHRILVIDDEQRMANSIQSLLSSCGYEVEAAYRGRDGITKLSEQDFHLVITDLRMSDLDGFEVIRTIGEQRKIGFIVITGHASTESAIEALHYKVLDYITKPFDFEVLRSAVARALAKIDAERFRDDMISMITHDIKIPLSSIIGYSTLIFDKEKGTLNPRAREFVQSINANGIKILSLIDNFLTSCKIDAGKLSVYPRDVNITYILEDLLHIFQVELERQQVNLEVNLRADAPTIMGDENLLFRAISNVLSNAVKYTPRSGLIRLKTDVVEALDSPIGKRSLLITVSNTGPGIPPEELPQIFDKYRRSQAHTGIEGSGIGSYVLRYVVEAHGGKVTVSSVPNELTTFCVYLPLEPNLFAPGGTAAANA
jgi:signal transduction histidine kinase